LTADGRYRCPPMRDGPRLELGFTALDPGEVPQLIVAPSTESVDDEVLDLGELLVDCTEVGAGLLTVVSQVLSERGELRARVCLVGGKLLAQRIDGLTVGVGRDCDVAQPLVHAVDSGVEPVDLRGEAVDSLTHRSDRGQHSAVVGPIGFQGRNTCFKIGQRGHDLIVTLPAYFPNRQIWARGTTSVRGRSGRGAASA
jgi:hypothetical protein